jgi:hypothetical protein
MSNVDDAIDFCSTFDAGLKDKIEGATQKQIDDIENFLNRPMGETHRHYLERLGGKCGWLSIGAFDTSAAGVMRAHNETSGELAAGYDLFGVAPGEPFEDVYLVDHESGEPAVYGIPTLRTGHYSRLPRLPRTLMAGSLPELLCRVALTRFRLEAAPLRAYYSQVARKDSLYAAFDAAMTGAGLSIAWFSDWMTRVALVEGLAVLAKQRPGESMYVRIGGEDPERFSNASEILREELNLQILPSDA